MISVSTLIGVNIAFFSYCLVLRKMKVYVSLPLTLAIYFLSRNLVMKNCLERIYLPLDYVFKEIR
jgi:L-lactate permease